MSILDHARPVQVFVDAGGDSLSGAVTRLEGSHFSIELDEPRPLAAGATIELLLELKGTTYRVTAEVAESDGTRLLALGRSSREAVPAVRVDLPAQFRAVRASGCVGVWRAARLCELDAEGLRMTVTDAINPSERLQVTLTFSEPGSGASAARCYDDCGAAIKTNSDLPPMRATAQVVDITPRQDGSSSVSLRFTALTHHDRSTLFAFLQQKTHG